MSIQEKIKKTIYGSYSARGKVKRKTKTKNLVEDLIRNYTYNQTIDPLS